MAETKTVRLDKELLDNLAEKREGFETPNECLKRLLNKRECSMKFNNRNGEEGTEDES